MTCSTSSQGLLNGHSVNNVEGNFNQVLQILSAKRKVGFPQLRLRHFGKYPAKRLVKALVSDKRRESSELDGGRSLLYRDLPLQAPDEFNGLSFPYSLDSSASKLLRVAVDVDEVLGSFLSSLNAFIKEKYQACYDVSEYYVYDFMKIWKCSQAEANHRVHDFFKSNYFNDGIKPIPGAYQSLCRLSPFCDLVVVTSRQHVIREPTLQWISKHFKGLFKEIHFGNHFALEGHAVSKSQICKTLGVQFLIDDNPKYAVECADEGIEVLLFDLDFSYPWSKTTDGPSHPSIKRVRNWDDVEKKLVAYVQSSDCAYL